jgi:hypothetical protein
MRLITSFELATRTTKELHVLFREVSTIAVQSEPGTDTRRNAIASLRNIACAM